MCVHECAYFILENTHGVGVFNWYDIIQTGNMLAGLDVNALIPLEELLQPQRTSQMTLKQIKQTKNNTVSVSICE